LRRIRSFSDLKFFIEEDFKQKKIKFKWILLIDPLFRFHLALRIYEFLINRGSIWRHVFKVYYYRLSIRLGFSIPPNVFDSGLCIVHYGNIIINPNSSVGKNCRIHVGVNIGGKAGFFTEEEAKNLCPIIGDNCYIGPGAKIFGAVKIANNCSIGANAVVTKSFSKEHSILIGIPARRLENES
jgi:serine O-acetyltransferase